MGRKIVSLLLALVCIFGLAAGGIGLRDIVNSKDYWEKSGAEAEESFEKLQGGIDQLQENEETYVSGVDTYTTGLKTLEDGKKSIAENTDKLTAGEASYQENAAKLADGKAAYAQGESDLAAGQAKLADSKTKLAAGRSKLDDSQAQLAAGKAQLADSKAQLAAGKAQLEEAKKQYAAGKQKLADNKQAYEDGKKKLESSKSFYDAAVKYVNLLAERDAAAAAGDTKTYNYYNTQVLLNQGTVLAMQIAGYTPEGIIEEYENGQALIKEYEDGEKQIAEAEVQIAAAEQKIADGEVQMAAAEAKIAAAEAKLTAGENEYASKAAQLAEGEKTISAGEKKLADSKAQIESGEAQLAAGRTQLDDGAVQLEEGKAKLADGEKQLAEGLAKLNQYEGGAAQVAEGLELVLATEAYADSKGNALMDSIAQRMGDGFSYWKVDEQGEVVQRDGKQALDLTKASDVVKAGYEFLEDTRGVVTKELVSRGVIIGLAMLGAVAGLVATVIGFLRKNRAALVLGIVAAATAVASLLVAVVMGTDWVMSATAGSTVKGISLAAPACCAAAAVAFTVLFSRGREKKTETVEN